MSVVRFIQAGALAGLGLLALSQSALAAADSYPTKPVLVVVPYPAGGQPDIAARLVSDWMTKTYSHRFVVENRVGAAGSTGSTSVAKATPDGYTLLVGSVASHGVNPTILPNIPYDAMNDFEHIALLAQAPSVLVVHPSVPVNNFKEFIEYAKANPGKLNFASPGAGTLNRLSMETIKKELGLDIRAVPYRGAGPAFNDVVAGHVKVKATNIELAVPMVAAGKLKALAVSSKERSTLLKDVPTYAELGYPQFTATVWSGLFAPKGTPADIVAKLNANAREALKRPETVEVMQKLGITVEDLSSEEYKSFVESQIKMLGDQVRKTGITLDQ